MYIYWGVDCDFLFFYPGVICENIQISIKYFKYINIIPFNEK